MHGDYFDGFPDDVRPEDHLVDGFPLVGQAAFWPAYFLNQSIEEQDLLCRVYSVDAESVGQMQRLLSDPRAWPRFDLDLPRGGRITVIFRNYADDPGVDYLLAAEPDGRSVRISALGGDAEGPGISWPELVSVADHGTDPREGAVRLLLLAPMLGDADADELGATARVVESLRLTGATGDLGEVARLIVAENLDFEPASWEPDDDDVNVCDGESSPRNPDGVVSLKVDELLMVSSALTP
ncbi:hypothetical protein GCM10010532_111280 [Dactylosporangium siamense]|uniref:Uncharacterized protein n=2 Tax=Dactylosporangium siamense TaxID=685454 RepID=A0A919Q112_9ACTN|nr:hypothetical protein Dsi01nite_109670 [Dactylosporangium siamense]